MVKLSMIHGYLFIFFYLIMSSLDNGSGSPIENGGEGRKQDKNESKLSKIDQCQNDIDCLDKKKTQIPSTDLILGYSESDLLILCQKYNYSIVREKAESIDPIWNDGNLKEINIQQALDLQEVIGVAIENNKLELKYKIREQYAQKIEDIDESGKKDPQTMAQLGYYVGKALKINYYIMSAKGIDKNTEIVDAEQEAIVHSSLLRVAALTIKAVGDIDIPSFAPDAMASTNEKKYDSRSQFAEEVRKAKEFGVVFPKEFIDQYIAIKDAFISFLKEYEASSKNPSQRIENIFNDMDDFHQTLTLFIYYAAIQSNKGELGTGRIKGYKDKKNDEFNEELKKLDNKSNEDLKQLQVLGLSGDQLKIKKGEIERKLEEEKGKLEDKKNALDKKIDLLEIRRKGKIGSFATDIVAGAIYINAHRDLDLDAVEKYDKASYEFFPHNQAKYLIRRAPSAEKALNDKFLQVLEKMQKDLPDLERKVLDETNRRIEIYNKMQLKKY